MRLLSIVCVALVLALSNSAHAAVSSQITSYQPYPFYDNPNVIDGTITTVPIVNGAPNQAPYGYVVYLPPGYSADTTTNWPVVFCLLGVGEFGTGRDANHLYSKMITHGPLYQVVNKKWDFPAIVIAPQAFSFGLGASLYPTGASGGWGSSNYLRGMVQFTKANYRVDNFRVYMTGLCEGAQGTINYSCAFREDLAAAMPIQTISRPVGNPAPGQPGPTDAQRSAAVAPILDLPLWMVHTWGDRSYKKENHLMWADDIIRTLTGQSSNIMASYPYLYAVVAPGYDRFAANIMPETGLPDFTSGLSEGSGGAESVGFNNCVVTPGTTVITRSSGSFPSWGSYSWTGNIDGSKPGALLEIGNNAATKIRVPIYYSNTTKIFLAKPYTGTLSGSNITCSVITPNGYPVTAHHGAQGWVWEAGVVAPTERPAVERIFTLYPVNSHVWGWRWIWDNTSAWNWMFRQAKAGAPQRNDPPTITVAGASVIVQGANLPLSATVSDPNGDLLTVGWDYDGNGSDDATGLSVTVPWTTLSTLGTSPVQLKARVSDGRGGTAQTTFLVTITNAPPITTAGGPYMVNEGSSLALVGTASDPGGDALTLTWDLGGDGSSDASGLMASFSWSQLVALGRSDGTFSAVFQATDSNGASVSSTAQVTILNLAPTVVAGGPYSVLEGGALALGASATDPGGDALTISWDLNGDGTFGDATGVAPTIPWATLSGLGFGTRTLAVRAVDGAGASAIATANLTINHAPPTLVVPGPITIVEGGVLALSASGTDAQGGMVEFAWDLDGDGAFDDAVGGSPVITWLALRTLGFSVGEQTISVRASDSLLASTTGNVVVTVTDVPTTVSIQGPYAILEGAGVSLTAIATDPGQETFVYAWDLDGDGSFDDAQGSVVGLAWTQLAALGLINGERSISVQVGTSVSSTVLTITNVAPTVAAGGPYSTPINQAVTVTAVGADAGGDVLAYAWDLDADGAFDDGAAASLSVSTTVLAGLGLGDHTISVRVTDSEGLQAIGSSTLSATLILHADTQAWKSAVLAAGGNLTTPELAAHDRWRLDVGDEIAGKFRLAHMYWVQDPIAKRIPYFRTWGPAQLTVVGSPQGVPLGYNFDGTSGKYIRTGVNPSTQPGFSQFDQFFLAWTFGATDTLADRPIAGARSNSGQHRTGVNWRISGTRMEVYAGRASETDNNFAATAGPTSGSLGLRALGGTAVSYQDDVAKVSTVKYLTDAKPAAEEYVGTINGIGTSAFKGTIGCWFRGVGLTDSEYRTLHQATETLVEALSAPANPN